MACPILSLDKIYYEEEVAGMRKRFSKVRGAFQEAFGHQAQHVVRVPGRVNLIGEHIDYSGFAVMPMALSVHDVVVAVSAAPASAAELDLCNLSASYTRCRSPLSDETLRRVGSGTHDWSHYVLAAYAGVRARLGVGSRQRFCLLIDGSVPAGSGLSSSSALVCAATLAFVTAARADISAEEQAELCAQSERLLGLHSGGMDQAAGMLSRRGSALRVDFGPLRAVPLTLPPTGVWVVLHSLRVSRKLESAYNVRVLECRLAAQLLAHVHLPARRGTQASSMRTLRQCMDEMRVDVIDFQKRIDRTLRRGGYDVTQLAEAFGLTETEVREHFLGGQVLPQGGVQLKARARHCASEAWRVLHMENLCGRDPYEDQLTDMGELLDESHKSCRVDYECSCPELDKLTEICHRAGAVGARLTGAGWGGCAVALVPQAAVTAFLSSVRENYYEKYVAKHPELRPLDGGIDPIVVTRPGQGAVIVQDAMMQSSL